MTSNQIREVVRQHWERRAEKFDDQPNHGIHSDQQRDAWLAHLSDWAGSPPRTALDVGCGTGFMALLLASLGHVVFGVDVAGEMLDRARAKAFDSKLNATFTRSSAETLSFADKSFDLVVERHVIWTLPDPEAALAEWMRVLRPGGQLVLVEGDWRSTGHEDYAPIRDSLPLYGGRPSPELVSVVLSAGFDNVSAQPLMDERLWGAAPERERYALRAYRPLNRA